MRLSALNPLNWIKRAVSSSKVTLEWLFGTSIKSDADIAVTITTALGLSTVWRAVNIVAGLVSTLPFDVYRRDKDGGKHKDTKHPAFELLRHRFNPHTSSQMGIFTMQAAALLNGNGYAWIERDGSASPVGLWLLDENATTPVKVENVLYYKTKMGDGTERTIHESDIFHIRGLGDGVSGYSVISYAVNSIGMGLAAQRHSNRFFANNAQPGGILKVAGQMKEADKKQLKKDWDARVKGDGTYSTALLEYGIDFTPNMINAKDSQLIESMEFSRTEIANLFGVPPHRVGAKQVSSFKSLHEENKSFLQSTGEFWLRQWQDEANQKLLTEREKKSRKVFTEFNRKAYLEADTETKINMLNKALAGHPFMTTNEARAVLNMNPIDDPRFDTIQVPTNNFGEESSEPEEEPEEEPAEDERAKELQGKLDRAHAAFNGAMDDVWKRMHHRLAIQVRKAWKNGIVNQWYRDKLFNQKEQQTRMSAFHPHTKAISAITGETRTALSTDERLQELYTEANFGEIRTEEQLNAKLKELEEHGWS